MLACVRCGKQAYANLQARIVKASVRKPTLFFVTIYYDPRWMKDFSDLPLFPDWKQRVETVFRGLMSKLMRALRDKLRRAGMKPEYVLVLALAKVRHRIHKVLHAHLLITHLPDTKPRASKKRPDRLECPWLEEKAAKEHLIVWIEKPRSRAAVARYTAQNAKSVIGKKEYKGMRVYRFSEGYENDMLSAQ